MSTQFCLPEVRDIGLDEVLESILADGILEEDEGVGEVVGVAVCSDVSHPVLTTLARGGEELNCNGMEDVTRQIAYHSKECELLKMKECLTRETPSQEEHYWVLSF